MWLELYNMIFSIAELHICVHSEDVNLSNRIALSLNGLSILRWVENKTVASFRKYFWTLHCKNDSRVQYSFLKDFHKSYSWKFYSQVNFILVSLKKFVPGFIKIKNIDKIIWYCNDIVILIYNLMSTTCSVYSIFIFVFVVSMRSYNSKNRFLQFFDWFELWNRYFNMFFFNNYN